MTIEQLTVFLGWATVINMGILLLAFFALVTMKNTIMPIHQKMLGMSETDLSKAYFQYMAQYKILIIVFNLAPYLSLRVMG
jgi:hypothetical protein